MLTGPGGLLSLIFILFGFLNVVQAAEKDLTKLGNRTIERVSYFAFSLGTVVGYTLFVS